MINKKMNDDDFFRQTCFFSSFFSENLMLFAPDNFQCNSVI